MLQDDRRSGRHEYFVLDLLHIAVGVLIVILAVLAFLNPEKNRLLFPVIFFLASVVNLVNGYARYYGNRGRKKQKAAGTALMALGIGLFLLCVISALTIWWG